MYQLTGLVIAGLMAGLAVGSGVGIKILNELSLSETGIFLLLFYAVIGSVLQPIIGLKYEFPALVLIIFPAFLPALLSRASFFMNLQRDRMK